MRAPFKIQLNFKDGGFFKNENNIAKQIFVQREEIQKTNLPLYRAMSLKKVIKIIVA